MARVRDENRVLATAVGFCLLIAYLTLFFRLGSVSFLGADEARYARVAQEMLESGDLITPTLEHRPWLEKPPLLYWLTSASYRVWGVSEASARIPGALAGLATALMIGLFATPLFGSRTGFYGFMILCTSCLFVGLSRSASTDALLLATLTGALICGYRAVESRGLGWSVGSGLLLAGAALAKGPVSLLLFGGIFAAYSLIRREFPGTALQLLAGALAFLAGALPWYWLVWNANGYDFIATFWLNHHIARFISDIHHHGEPVWYYIPVIFFGFFPWVFHLGSALRQSLRLRGADQAPERNAQWFLWIWLAVPFLFFSAAESKLAGYVLPMFPPLSLLVARIWDRHTEVDVESYRGVKSETAAVRISLWILAAALPVVAQSFYGDWQLGARVAAPLLLGALLLQWSRVRANPASLFLTIVAVMTLFISNAFWNGGSVFEDHHSTKGIISLALPEISRREPLVFYRYFHHTARYYSGYQTIDASIDSLDGLLGYVRTNPQESYIVLTKKEGWRDLRTYFPSQLLRQEGNLFLVRVASSVRFR